MKENDLYLGLKRKPLSTLYCRDSKNTNIINEQNQNQKSKQENISLKYKSFQNICKNIQPFRPIYRPIQTFQNNVTLPQNVQMKFDIIKEYKFTRVGILTLPQGRVETPAIIPVGIKGDIRGLLSYDIQQLGINMISSSIYPFIKEFNVVNEKLKIHEFNNAKYNIITTNGRFHIQTDSNKIDDNKDLSKTIIKNINKNKKDILVSITPEQSIQIQHNIGGDIMISLDEAIDPYIEGDEQINSCKLNTTWSDKSIKKYIELSNNINNNKNIPLFGVIQGGFNISARKNSIDSMIKRNFNGYCIGGLKIQIDTDKEEFWQIIKQCTDKIPKNKIRYLFGFDRIVECMMSLLFGVDLIDSSEITRRARLGSVITNDGWINIKSYKYKNDFSPIDKKCTCDVCRKYSRSYFFYMYKKNPRALTLMTIHNLYFYNEFFRKYRKAVKENKLNEFVYDILSDLFFKREDSYKWLYDSLLLAGIDKKILTDIFGEIYSNDGFEDDDMKFP